MRPPVQPRGGQHPPWRPTMSDNEVRFSGNPNTMIALTLVASALSLALSMWSVSRVGELEAFVAVQAIADAGGQAGH